MDSGEARRIAAAFFEDAERRVRAAMERTCDEHPATAAEVRRRYERLRTDMDAADEGVRRETPEAAFGRGDGAVVGADAPGGSDMIGPYRVLRELGRGGQAIVHLAEDVRLGRHVALKVFEGFGPVAEARFRRFRREAEAASRLDHPGICPVYDAGVVRGVPYIALRYVEGETLAEGLAAARGGVAAGEGPPTVAARTEAGLAESLEIVEKTARALHVAHEAGIVHRDVKPGNIMITPRGDPVLLDFGLADDDHDDAPSLGRTAATLGTPAYMSPEQLAEGAARVDRRTDVYSLGVTLYECLTLERPFGGATREAVYEAIRGEEPPDVRKLVPGLSRDVKVVVDTALAKDRDRRYRTAEAFADDLARARRGEPIAARRASAVERAWRWARRRPMRAALVAVLAIGAPVLAALLAHVVGSRPAIREAEARAFQERVDERLEVGFDALGHDAPRAALAAFDAALALKPGGVEALTGKALALGRSGDYAACLRFLETEARGAEPQAALRSLRITALRNTGREGEASDAEKAPAPPIASALGRFLVATTFVGDRRGGAAAGPDLKDAWDLLLTAAFSAPEARRIYHLAAMDVARRRDRIDDAERFALGALLLWPETPLVNLRAAEALVERRPATAYVAARKAHAAGPVAGAATAADDAWLLRFEARVLDVLRRGCEQGALEGKSDPWLRALNTIERCVAIWEGDVANGRRTAAVKTHLTALRDAPFDAWADPASCHGLPADSHDAWRRARAEADALLRRLGG